jgi:hypothetical protein
LYASVHRSLALLFAGAITGLIGSLLVRQVGFSCLILTALLIALIILVLFGTGVDSLVTHRYYLWARKKVPKIGILNDMGWPTDNEQIKAWTDINPQAWIDEIKECVKGKKFTVKLIKTTENFARYSAVINPYGGVYPENDLVSFATLGRIFVYVREGGLFVNVADIPGYWAYNPLLKKRTEAAPPVWDVVPAGYGIGLRALRPFTIVPWMQRLGLKVLNVENVFKASLDLEVDIKFKQIIGCKAPRVRIHRVAVLEENVEAVHKMSVPDEFGETKSVTSMFFATYGDGAFLISLVFITDQVEGIKQELKRILIDLTLHKIMRKVT